MTKKNNDKIRGKVIMAFLLAIYKVTFGLYLKLKFNLKIIKNDIYKMPGPYILLANHTHNMDGCFIQTYWSTVISFVVNDTACKIKSIRGLLDLAGFIAIKKMTTDSSAVRGILKNIRQGRIIGIFPEGKRSWDGCTTYIIPSTASLIKKLKVPVVTVKLSGAMMSRPRWSMEPRRGKIIIEPKVVLTKEQIKELSADEIYDVIIKELDHDETTFLRENEQIKFKGKAMAEHLELFLYVCHDCGAIAKMRSENDQFFCTICQSRYSFDEDATLYKDNGKTRYTLKEWSEYQEKFTLKDIEEAKTKGDIKTILFEDNDVSFYEYIRLEPLKFLSKGTLSMTSNGMTYISEKGEKKVFLADDIMGSNIQRNNQFEFTYEGKTFRFLFNERVSPFKWQLSLKCAKSQ